jgi:hypothetical protein
MKSNLVNCIIMYNLTFKATTDDKMGPIAFRIKY